MLTRIQGGRVIDPGHLDTIADILIKDNKIAEIVKEGQKEAIGRASRTINASGKIVCPGFIDMHVHLREPGHEHKETIERMEANIKVMEKAVIKEEVST